MIQVHCTNNGETLDLVPGITLQEVYDAFALDMPYGAVSARVNNKVESLSFRLYNPKEVEFLDITSSSGMRTTCALSSSYSPRLSVSYTPRAKSSSSTP